MTSPIVDSATDPPPTPGPLPGRAMPRTELIAVVLVEVAHPTIAPRFLPKTPVTVVDVWTSALWTIGVILLFATLLRRRNEVGWPMYRPARNWAHEIAVAVTIGVLAFATQQIVSVLMWTFVGGTATPDAWEVAMKNPIIRTMFPVYTLIAAIREEVVFRAYLPVRISATLGVSNTIAVIISAAMFAAIHDYPAPDLASVFVTGLVYGATYSASRSLPCIVIAHWTYNLLVTDGLFG
jgi:membrane protease YdiL (CAAX protease family)